MSGKIVDNLEMQGWDYSTSPDTPYFAISRDEAFAHDKVEDLSQDTLHVEG